MGFIPKLEIKASKDNIANSYHLLNISYVLNSVPDAVDFLYFL